MKRHVTSGKARRILIVISSASIGGGQTHALLLLRCLQADPLFEPHVVCHPGGDLARMVSAMNIPSTCFELEDLRHCFDLFRFVKHLRHERFDLIHAHLNRAALISSCAGKLASTPVLCTAHGMTRSLYYRFADHVIAVSNAVKSHLTAQTPALQDRTTVIHNGIPSQVTVSKERLRQLKKQYFLQQDERVISVIGTFHPNKGQHIAIRALHSLPSHLRLRLLLVGDGPDKKRLEKLVKVLALGPRVTFIPTQPRLYEIYALSDFVIVPSQTEALSMVILEALRQARPVIASDTGGIPEIIKPNYNGTLVAPNDPEALAAAIERGLRDYRRHETLANAGQKTVNEQFSIERCYLATRKCYLDVLGLPIS